MFPLRQLLGTLFFYACLHDHIIDLLKSEMIKRLEVEITLILLQMQSNSYQKKILTQFNTLNSFAVAALIGLV